MFEKVSAIGLFVTDLEQSIVFYRDKVGLKLKSQEKGFAALELGGIELALIDLPTAAEMITEVVVSPKKPAGPVRHSLSVDVGNVEATYREFLAKGVEFVKPPVDQPWGQTTAYFHDPDGNVWEIYTWKTPQGS